MSSIRITQLPTAIVPHEDDYVAVDSIANGTKKVKITDFKNYVTPEMFGAVGDGVEDDTSAIQDAFDSSKLILLNSTYKISASLNVKSDSIIIGIGNVKINGGNHAIFNIANKSNIIISGVHLSSTSVEGALNANIRLVESSNISIDNCSFEKGCYGINVYNCNNLSIEKCLFSDFLVNDNSGNGGYAILLESTKATKINDCIFNKNINGKHAIYISVRGDEAGCENTTITGCYFDNSLQTHKAPTTVPINVRASINTIIDSCVFDHTSGCITLVGGNGNFVGIKILNNLFKNYEYSAGAAETRSRINLNIGSESTCDIAIENNVSFVDDGIVRQNKEHFLSAYNSNIYLLNNESKDGLYCIIDSCNIEINGFKTNADNCAFRFMNIINGSEKDVEASSASRKFIFNNASMRIDFFEPKDNRFFLRVRSDSFNSGVINKSYSITTSNDTINNTLVHQVKFPFTLLGGVGAFQYNLSSKMFLQFSASGNGDFNFSCIDPNSNRLYPNMYVEFISIENVA